MPVPDKDRAVLQAARVVLLRDPRATMSAIAAEAGVGVGSLYRRYANKEELFQAVCGEGLRRYIAIAEATLSDLTDPWHAFAGFIQQIVDSGSHQLIARVAAEFPTTEQLRSLYDQADACADRVFRLARGSGVLRTDVTRTDVSLLLDQICAIELGNELRTGQLRRRYLGVVLDGLRAEAATGRLPGPPPREAELVARGLSLASVLDGEAG